MNWVKALILGICDTDTFLLFNRSTGYHLINFWWNEQPWRSRCCRLPSFIPSTFTGFHILIIKVAFSLAWLSLFKHEIHFLQSADVHLYNIPHNTDLNCLENKSCFTSPCWFFCAVGYDFPCGNSDFWSYLTSERYRWVMRTMKLHDSNFLPHLLLNKSVVECLRVEGGRRNTCLFQCWNKDSQIFASSCRDNFVHGAQTVDNHVSSRSGVGWFASFKIKSFLKKCQKVLTLTFSA